MQIYPNLEPGSAGPRNSIIEVRDLPLDVGVTIERVNGPVAYRDAHVVHSRGGDLLQVTRADEAGPVRF